MAEEKAKEEVPKGVESTGHKDKEKPTLFLAMSAFNILVVLGVGILLYLGNQSKNKQVTMQQVVEGEKQEQDMEAGEDPFIGEFVPMETFFVNLAGSRGAKIARVTMEMEIGDKNTDLVEEIERRKPQIRDIIIILLSSKTYEQISTIEGKDNLRDEIKVRLNSFLTRGKIKSVLFTEFLLN